MENIKSTLLIISLVLSVVTPRVVIAQKIESLTNTVELGESFTIELSNAEDFTDIDLYDLNGIRTEQLVDGRWSIVSSASDQSSNIFYAIARGVDQFTLTNRITIDRTYVGDVVDISFENPFEINMTSGSTESLRILSRLPDGNSLIDTLLAQGIAYSIVKIEDLNESTDPSESIVITRKGDLLAVKPGEANIVVQRGGLTISRRVIVRPFSDADADGDGVSDALELQIGTDLYRRDSDFDNIPDAIEVGLDDLPLDTNQNSIIDALEPELLINRSGLDIGISIIGGNAEDFRKDALSDQLDITDLHTDDFDLGTLLVNTKDLADSSEISLFYESVAGREVQRILVSDRLNGVVIDDIERLENGVMFRLDAAETSVIDRASFNLTPIFSDFAAPTPIISESCSTLGNSRFRWRDRDYFALVGKDDTEVNLDVSFVNGKTKDAELWVVLKERKGNRWIYRRDRTRFNQSAEKAFQLSKGSIAFIVMNELRGKEFRSSVNYCIKSSTQSVRTSVFPLLSVE